METSMESRIIKLNIEYEELKDDARIIFCTDNEIRKFYKDYGLIFFATRNDDIAAAHYIFSNPALKKVTGRTEKDLDKAVDIIMDDYENWRLRLLGDKDLVFWFGIFIFKNIVEPIKLDTPENIVSALQRITIEFFRNDSLRLF